METQGSPGHSEHMGGYSHIKEENPRIHRKISNAMGKSILRALEEAGKGNIEPSKLLASENSLREAIHELRGLASTVQRQEEQSESSTIQPSVSGEMKKFIDDLLKCLENLRLIRELDAMEKSGNPLGYDPLLMERAAGEARRQVFLLAQQVETFSFPGSLGYIWNGIRARLRPQLIVVLAALGIAFSPGYADTPQLEIFSPLASFRDLRQPEMRQQGNEAGKFEKGRDLAHIQGNLPEFFATHVYEFDGEGHRAVVPMTRQGSMAGDVMGTVTFSPARYEKGAVAPLFVPLGFVPRNVRMSPDTPFVFAQDYLTFKEGSHGPAEIVYGISPVEQSPYILHTAKRDFPLPSSPEIKKLVSEVAKHPTAPESAIKEYLEGFTYVVSSELQEMVDRIPGSMEYKTGLIRAGDCDVLADHLAHALKKYIPAGVAPGFWNADGDTTISEGEAHARFVYTTSDGRLKAIETTEHPKRSFVNLTFLPGDRVLLEGKINEIEKASQKQKEVRMRAFGQTLEEILKKEAYARFRPKGNFISALSRIQKEQSGDRTGQQGESTGKDRGKGEESGGEGRGDKRDGAGLLDSLEKLDDWRVNLALMALLGALAVATGAGIGISSIILQEKMKRRIQAGNFFKDIELLEAIKTRIPLEKLRKTSEGIEAEFADLCYEFSIPQEVSRTFSGDEKDALVLLHAMRDQQRFFLISYLFASGRVNALRFRKTLTEVAQSQEGVTREDIIETIRTVCESEKFRNIADEAQAKAVDSIWSMVRKYFAEVDARSEEAQLGDILDTGPSVDGGKISRHPGSDEFYQSRPYQKGDDPRHIDQRASGRFDVPLVREFRAGMGGAKQRSFHLVVDLPSVADWEVANLVHLLALAHRKKNVAVNGIDFYAFGMPIQRLSAETMRKLIDNPQLDTEGFKKLVNIIVAGRVRESIHVADSTHNRGMNTYSGLMLSSKMHESLARNHTIVYLGETRGMTTLRSMVHMKQRAPRSSAPPSTAA